jgi:vanillate O-demethylase monooxygenase subunit
VAEDRCPHRSTPLHLGMVRNDRLVCSRHGLEYDPLGPCVLIPGQSPWSIPSELRLRTYPVREHLGLVWTCLSAVGANELPEIAEWKDSTYQKVHPPVVEMNASAGRQLEGFLDVAHLPWIHHQTFADRSRTEVPNYDVEKTAYGLQIEYHSPVGNYLRQDGEEVNSAGSALRVWDVYLPLAAKLKAHNAGGANPIVLNIASPVSARKTRLFTAILRNYDQDQPVEPYIDFNLRIFKEDQEIVERQCPEELPLSLHDEVHIRADRASIMYRQELSRLGLGKMFTA